MLTEQLQSLNVDQREVALCDTHCLAIAAPGSGKTKTLAVKAARILSSGQTVTAVTFTRDSALELRERILAIAGEASLPRLLVGTFHSIDLLMAFPKTIKSPMGKEILQKGFSKLTRKWEIVREANRRNFVARSLQNAGVNLDIEAATSAIEAYKAGHLKQPPPEIEDLVSTYTSLLTRYGVIDFQDILLETNKAIEAGQISPLHTSHLLIDEFQDTDHPQYTWAMMHAKAGVTVTAVGDDDQSIYGFRRALGYKGMVDFASELDAKRVVLGMNYRSFEEVLAPARTLIASNGDRMAKQLVAAKGKGGSAFWERYTISDDEVRFCVEWIKDGLAKNLQVGVLTRTNKRLDPVEALCIGSNIPYNRADGGGLLQTSEMAAFSAMLGVIVEDQARDADAALAWCGVEEEELASLHKVLGANGMASLTKKQLDQASLSSTSKSAIAMLAKRRHEWLVLLETGGIDFVLEGVHSVLSAAVPNDKRSINTLWHIRLMYGRVLEGGSGSVKEKLQTFRSSIDRKSKDGDLVADSVNRVSLMTAHSSKGLEWDRVWILGAEQGVFPDESAGNQEERRLFYVAMTRARRDLMVSSSGSRPISHFVGEAGLPRSTS